MVPRNIINRIGLARAYLTRRSKINAFPFEVSIGITNRCNLDCKFCPHRFSQRSQGNISLDLLNYLLDQMAPYIDAVDLSFDGEPFLHPRWVECIEACHRHGIRVILQTNNLLMDESLAREIISVGIDFIIFSIDAASEETYSLLKPSGDYSRVVSNVERFLHMSQQQRQRPYTMVQLVKTPENSHEVKPFIRLWKGKGADYIRIKPMFNFGGSISSKLPVWRVPVRHLYQSRKKNRQNQHFLPHLYSDKVSY